jgi:hypothetical protein
MAFADTSVYKDVGDGSILGRFNEVDTGNLFEYSVNNDNVDFAEGFPHKVWVTTPHAGIDSGFRYAKVLKTRIYIAVDEDENGPVVEKWFIKRHHRYGFGVASFPF